MTVPRYHLAYTEFYGEFVPHYLFAHTFCVMEVHPAEQP